MTTSAGPRPDVWRWAFWFALIACLGQVALVEVARAAGRLIFLGRDYVWMTLLADLLVFTVAALVIGGVVKILPPSRQMVPTLAVFLFLVLLGPSVLIPGLHRYAMLLLITGSAIQAARVLGSHRSLFELVVRRTIWALVVLALISAATVKVSRNLFARTPNVSLPPAAAGSPNVVLIVLDTVRAQNLGLYGYARDTSPMLERLARTGVTFERAFSTAPWTLPSHATMFTGHLPHQQTANWLSPLDDTHPTLAEAFNVRGYRTGGFVANLLYTTAETGLSRGFSDYKDYPITAPMAIKSSWLARLLVGRLGFYGLADRRVRKHAPEVSAEFLQWLSVPSNKPFFAFLNYFDAHRPYRVPEPYLTRFGAPLTDLPEQPPWSAPQLQSLMAGYDGSLAYMDHQLGQLFDALEARGVLDNTLIVVTADHGEQFGEHGLIGHSNSLYRPLLQVPLVISFRGRVPAGVRIEHPVSLADLSATILDLVKVPGTPLPGRSLAENWQAPHDAVQPQRTLMAEVSKGINAPDWEPVSKESLQSVIAAGMHYIRHSNGAEELYDLDRDVSETDDLSKRPDARPALEEARRALEALAK